MKMIFLGDAAKDSGNFGFSEACPLCSISSVTDNGRSQCSPSCPNRVDVHSLSDVDNQFHVCVVVVVRAAGDLCGGDQQLLMASGTFCRQIRQSCRGNVPTSTY